jgi:four helix bundle protein
VPFLFENLKVYQESLRLATQIREATNYAPKGTADTVDQLRRASASIPANLAEGCGRWHLNDRKQFFWIARGSANECVPQLKLAWEQKIITQESYYQFRNSIEVIAKMISSLITSSIAHKKRAHR